MTMMIMIMIIIMIIIMNHGDEDNDDDDDELYPTGEDVHSDHDGLPDILGSSLHCDLGQLH